jgi:phosphate transport system substrate-binding protein
MKKYIAVFFFALLLASSVNAKEMEINGAGATFPFPLYSKMFDVYHEDHDVKIDYEGIGSSGGIKALTGREVDFGGTDAFMNDELIKKTGAEIVHIPTCLGAVCVTYNLKGVSGIHLSQEVLADIFLGKITRWNHRKIARLNPKVKLPRKEIIIVHRSDGSGTTNIFTDFLTKVSDDWAESVGRGKTVDWPVGIGVTKNSGVATMIKQLPGSIGYVEMAYAIENDLPVAVIENSSGNFIKPSLLSTSLSANAKIPDDTRTSLTNTSSKNGYPITGFTWIILYKEQNYNDRTLAQAQELTKLLWWMTHEGQKYATDLNYAPLPDKMIPKVEKLLRSITYDGESLIQ